MSPPGHFQPTFYLIQATKAHIQLLCHNTPEGYVQLQAPPAAALLFPVCTLCSLSLQEFNSCLLTPSEPVSEHDLMCSRGREGMRCSKSTPQHPKIFQIVLTTTTTGL